MGSPLFIEYGTDHCAADLAANCNLWTALDPQNVIVWKCVLHPIARKLARFKRCVNHMVACFENCGASSRKRAQI